MDKYITLINLVFTCISLACAVFSLRQTQKQTKIMQEQLDESRKPDFPVTMRLESIANELRRISESIKNRE